ncbi:MAG TPA: NAD(P)/FAD-dependent oxidoreductase [Micromonosporaceae bacterium]|jgi:flavin-dependent dehydrogenase|nr:NAD(P)/FAD-dependent oxidoreductase [Micromonosporaceae bacterium]
MEPTYDVIVVGARVAGAATAMLLARQGHRVLLLDRDRYGTDTLSTHALMRGAVFLLSRWGVLDHVIEAGTPPVRQTRFDYGTDSVTVRIKPTHSVDALYAPRRTVLDRVLVDAAEAAGAEIRYGISVTGLLCDRSGRVVGVHGRDRAGEPFVARGRLTVGADGIRSVVAREAGAATLRVGTGSSAVIYGYWSELRADGYEWFYRPGHSAGMIPTNGGQVCVFAGVPADRLTRGDLRGTYQRLLVLATDGADGRLTQTRPPRRLHTWIGRAGFVRQAHGTGWALVGDAGSFLDPLSTHGITDALRDAETLARCVARTATLDDLEEFAATRDRVIDATFDVVDRIAGYGWDLRQLQGHLLELSAAMSMELDIVAKVGPPVGR